MSFLGKNELYLLLCRRDVSDSHNDLEIIYFGGLKVKKIYFI